MSDAKSPEPDETAEPTHTPSTPEKKQRSPVERAVVWGLISVLLIVLGIEALAETSYKSAFKNMEQLMDKKSISAEQDGGAISETDVAKAVGGKKPSASESTSAMRTKGKTDVYVWQGVLKKRKLYVHYGIAGVKGEPELLWFSAKEEEEMSPTFTAPQDELGKAESEEGSTESKAEQESTESDSKTEPAKAEQ